MNTIEEFKMVKKYKTLALITIFLTIPTVFLIYSEHSVTQNLGYILFFLLVVLGLFFCYKYQCPACGKVQDMRFEFSRTVHCPKCGAQLQEKDHENWTGIR
ncbi:hypothetical protein [Desulforamulus aquiferis]|uniref:Uncharacterized protein n=1 Tax=Desulforamulus aquiferis TaxID=1397668 RepID=A0AAW7ZJ29_9FIRM|nr:hypothetical protein [Desulforamulus aquiferis]MDO7788796.1 hypothetical protein [Desulforamulus aquiferis]